MLRFHGGPEALVGLPVMYTLHRLGLAIPGNFWLFAVLLLAGTLFLGRVNLWQARRPSRLRAVAADAFQITYIVLVLCLTGWAPLLYPGFFVYAALRLNELARAWRSTLYLCLGAMAGMQAAIVLGVVYTYPPPQIANVAGVLTAMSVGLGIRALGMHAAARAAAESAQSASEEAARRSEERFRTVVQDSWDVIVITTAVGDMTFVSAAVEKVMGWDADGYRELAPDSRVHPDDTAALKVMTSALAEPFSEHRTELRLRHSDGTWHWHEVLARNLLANPSVQGIVYNHRDITVRKQREDNLAYEASHDALTGLANRTALRDRLAGWCGAERPVPGAVLFLDLDGFKQVNDRLGHAAGDEMLMSTARALLDCVTASDIVARLGGDEFAVLLTEVGTDQEAAVVAERIVERLGGAIRASIGITMCQPGWVDARETLHRADLAMYEAKRAGEHGWVVYDGSATVAVAQR